MEENFRQAKIVEAADKFIQKNTLRHEKHMRAAREAGADIREISLKSRKAQYVYLMKAAQECTTGMAGMSGSEEHRGRADASVTETAVLYRDNECAIPLIDLLERKNIPYRSGMQTFPFLPTGRFWMYRISSGLQWIQKIRNCSCRSITG